MSARAEHWVLQVCEANPELRPVHCHILQLLAIRHDHDYGMAWPSIARMAAESHYTERAIYKAMDELTAMVLVHRSYGDLPRKSRRDAAKLGNRYQFPGLDEISEEDQPRLLGGASRDERGSPEPDGLDERGSGGEMNLKPAADERDVTTQSRVDEPETHVTPELTATRSVAYVRNAQTQTRGPDEASPRPAEEDDGPAEPVPLHDRAQICPMCNKPFVGAYVDHFCPINRPPPRRLPPRIGKRIDLAELKRIEQELEDFNRGRREAQANGSLEPASTDNRHVPSETSSS